MQCLAAQPDTYVGTDLYASPIQLVALATSLGARAEGVEMIPEVPRTLSRALAASSRKGNMR